MDDLPTDPKSGSQEPQGGQRDGSQETTPPAQGGPIDQTFNLLVRPWSQLWSSTVLGGMWPEGAFGKAMAVQAASQTVNPVGEALRGLAQPADSRPVPRREDSSVLANIKDINQTLAAQSTSWLSLVQDVQRQMTSTVKTVTPRLPTTNPLIKGAGPAQADGPDPTGETDGGSAATARAPAAGKRTSGRSPAFELPSLEQGGFAQALVRTLLLVALAEGPLAQADFAAFENLRRLHPRLNAQLPGGLERIAREQHALCHGNRHKGAETIPCLLPRRIDRAEVLDVVRAILMTPGRLSYRGKGVFWGLEERLG